MKYLKPALMVTVGLWLVLSPAYTLAMVGLGQLLFPWQANGSQVALHRGGPPVASLHVGQYFSQAGYFWGRPSDTVSLATGKPKPYNSLASAPSNLGPGNKALLATIRTRIATLQRSIPGLSTSQIPASLVEGSGSGLDPDITLQGALIQIPRIAHATGLAPAYLRHLVVSHRIAPQLGVLGKAHVNVAVLNLAITRKLGHRAP